MANVPSVTLNPICDAVISTDNNKGLLGSSTETANREREIRVDIGVGGDKRQVKIGEREIPSRGVWFKWDRWNKEKCLIGQSHTTGREAGDYCLSRGRGVERTEGESVIEKASSSPGTESGDRQLRDWKRRGRSIDWHPVELVLFIPFDSFLCLFMQHSCSFFFFFAVEWVLDFFFLVTAS